MKNTPALKTLLEAGRAGKTSDDLSAAIEALQAHCVILQREHSDMTVRLEDAIASGKDTIKLHAEIATNASDLMDSEAAIAAFGRRLNDAQHREAGADLQARKDSAARIAAQLDADARAFADHGKAMRALAASIGKSYAALERENGWIEQAGDRPAQRGSSIVREAFGHIPKGAVDTSYGQRTDAALYDILTDNPLIARRAQNYRRGRVGETNQARDAATEGWMNLARDIDRKAGAS